jgi:protein SPA2
VVEQLRSDMQNLLTEVGDLSRRNDELMTAKDSDLVVIRDLDNQLKEYKRKYEQAKTELRSIKATSQLFLQAPKIDKLEDQLPVSADGGILDIHITAFLSAVDGLLTAGRSNAPTRVLSPMKSVVNAVTNIIDDARAYEKRPARSDIDMDSLRSLRERADATLSNLVTASKTHATSAGMSPVSLLDAAASHVAVTITDIGKMIFIRKATKAEQEQFASSSYSPSPSATSGFSPSLRSVNEKDHQRKGSAGPSALGSSSRYENPMYPTSRPSDEYARRTPSENSSSEKTNSPPPIFDQAPNTAGTASDGDGTEDNWAELKPYLEAQTESIVYAIQSVLSGVRSPTPSPTLNENVTQIITIVSSIVAVCKDNFPPTSAQPGNEILRELGDNANKLSEMQALPEVTKESRQVMAKSSFAIANAMKGLMKLE